MPTAIELKRAYEKPAKSDGFRVLVDRLWPRGVKKQDLRLSAWAKGLAPSAGLRKWFSHDPARWTAFCRRYRSELSCHAAYVIHQLLKSVKDAQTITLLYAAKDAKHNEAVVLRVFFKRAARTQANHKTIVSQ